MVKNYLLSIPMMTIDSATLTGAFDLIGVLPEPCSILRIVNGSKVPIIISYDGVNAHDFVFADGGNIDLNIQANSSIQNKKSMFRKGTSIYAKGAASIGLIYVAGYYNI